MTFDQAMAKLQAGKEVARTAWSSAYFLTILNGMNGIYAVYPVNTQNPCQLYSCNVADINGTDWNVM